jgi:hypothetical protein
MKKRNDFKVACVIMASTFVFAGFWLTRTVSGFAGREHELVILAAGMAFLAAGWFLGILSGFQTVARSLSIRPEPKWEVELVEVPYGGHIWYEGEEYVVEGTENTRAICKHIKTGEKAQISTYATVKVWTDVYEWLLWEREKREQYEKKVKAEGSEHITIKGTFCMHNEKFQIESEGNIHEAWRDFDKQYNAHLNKKYDSPDDQKAE